MRRAVALALVLSCIITAPARAATPQELSARIDEARRLAEAGEAIPSPARMAEVRDALGLPDTVTANGVTVPVPEDGFLSALEGDDAADFSAAVRRLDALATVVRSPSASHPELREDLRAAYGELQGTERGWLQRLQEFLGSILSGLLRGTGDALTGAPALWLLVAGAGLAVILLLRRRRLALVPEAAARADASVSSPADWRRLADAARSRGDLAGAVVFRYRALVAELARRGLVDDRPSLTAGEVRAAVALTGRMAAPLTEASRRYERVRYGGTPASDDDLAVLERAERTARDA